MSKEIKQNLKFKNKCNQKVLAKHSKESIMSDLVDFALDGYVESLKNENQNITKEEVNQKLKELVVWKKLLSKS